MENDQHIRNMLDKSRELYEELDSDLGTLYKVIHQEFDILDLKTASKSLSRMTFKSKIKFFAKMQRAQKKMRVDTVNLSDKSKEEKDSINDISLSPLSKSDMLKKTRTRTHIAPQVNVLKNLIRFSSNQGLEELPPKNRERSSSPERMNTKNMTATASSFNRENSRLMTTTLSTFNGVGRTQMCSPKNGGILRQTVNRLTKFSDRSFDREVSQIFEGKSDEDFVLQETNRSVDNEPDHRNCMDYPSHRSKTPF